LLTVCLFKGTLGVDYTWPVLATIDEFIAAGMNTFRINTLAERMVPDVMTGPFNESYMDELTTTVNYITGKGAYAMINPHNYGRYYGNIITSTSDFQTFWEHVAAVYKSNSLVMFDTNNEYHDMPGALVASLNQAAINGIRASGATTQWITAEGNAYTGAWTWTTATGTDGLTNAQTMGALTDPSNKLIYQVCKVSWSERRPLTKPSRCISTSTPTALAHLPHASTPPSVALG